ncbi:MAG: hypothetical protein V7647_3526 [Acidobacteriota bacterium]
MNPMVSHSKALAIASGLLVGGFLFLRFAGDNNAGLFSWEWYQGATLLGGIGLAGMLPGARLSVALGLCTAPLLVESIRTWLHVSRDPTCCSLWPIGLVLALFFGLPGPLIGSGISRLLTRIRLPRTVYAVPLTMALVIGALLPSLQHKERQRLETEIVPGLLKQIYDAEMVYRAGQPNGIFTCEGDRLPGAAGKLGWSTVTGSTMNKYLFIQHYTISLDCPNDISPRGFRVRASSHEFHMPAPKFSMDETGKLVVEPVR